MSRISFVRMYPSDWRSGCLGMTLEQEGLYCRVCMYQAETGRRIPLDDTQAARILNVTTKLYRRVMGSLIMARKVTAHEDGYGNDRAEEEHQKAVKGAARKPSATPEEGPDRETEEEQGRQPDAVPVTDNQVTTELEVSCNRVITEFVGEISQQNQQPLIEPITNSQELKKESPKPPLGASDEISLPPNITPITNWGSAFLRPDDHAGIEIVDGHLTLVNGTKVRWLENFGGDAIALDLALQEIEERINPNSRTAGLKRQVESKLAKIARDRRDRKANYDRAVERNAKEKIKPQTQEPQWGEYVDDEARELARTAYANSNHPSGRA